RSYVRAGCFIPEQDSGAPVSWRPIPVDVAVEVKGPWRYNKPVARAVAFHHRECLISHDQLIHRYEAAVRGPAWIVREHGIGAPPQRARCSRSHVEQEQS